MKLSLKNILVWVAGLLGLLVFIFSFVTAAKYTFSTVMGDRVTTMKGIIWGCKEATTVMTGQSNTEVFSKALGSPVAIVGAILVFVGAACAVTLSFVQLKNEMMQKIAMFAAAGFMVVGGVLTFFALEGFYASYAAEYKMTVAELKKALQDAKISCALPVVSGILAILGGGAVVASQFVKD